jgi:hypothetical protein
MNARVVRRAAELEDRGELHAIATVVRVDRPVSARPGARRLRPDHPEWRPRGLGRRILLGAHRPARGGGGDV